MPIKFGEKILRILVNPLIKLDLRSTWKTFFRFVHYSTYSYQLPENITYIAAFHMYEYYQSQIVQEKVKKQL